MARFTTERYRNRYQPGHIALVSTVFFGRGISTFWQAPIAVSLVTLLALPSLFFLGNFAILSAFNFFSLSFIGGLATSIATNTVNPLPRPLVSILLYSASLAYALACLILVPLVLAFFLLLEFYTRSFGPTNLPVEALLLFLHNFRSFLPLPIVNFALQIINPEDI